MIRLVACDLDGTLMGHDQRFGPRLLRALAEAQRRGITVTLATGRMFSATKPFAAQLRITSPLICYQGGWIQAPDDAAPRFRAPLPPDVTRQALDLGAAARWHTVLYADGAIYLQEQTYPQKFYEMLLGITTAVGIPWDEVLSAHTPDKVLFVAEPEAIPAMAARLRQRIGAQAEVVRSHAMFVEVVPREVNKGRALAWLAETLHIPQAEVLAIGDQENDAAMLRWAGIGVAMGNATAPARQAADWVAPSLSDEGAAVALEKFALEG